ncbi:hypothetical protein K438DRAFT_1753857 [Mycena galopus ATCC 62051]|nr:hypothetical protein K438DRAFT_1753857 [Mycena galopus ATCC 62051]
MYCGAVAALAKAEHIQKGGTPMRDARHICTPENMRATADPGEFKEKRDTIGFGVEEKYSSTTRIARLARQIALAIVPDVRRQASIARASGKYDVHIGSIGAAVPNNCDGLQLQAKIYKGAEEQHGGAESCGLETVKRKIKHSDTTQRMIEWSGARAAAREREEMRSRGRKLLRREGVVKHVECADRGEAVEGTHLSGPRLDTGVEIDDIGKDWGRRAEKSCRFRENGQMCERRQVDYGNPSLRVGAILEGQPRNLQRNMRGSSLIDRCALQ